MPPTTLNSEEPLKAPPAHRRQGLFTPVASVPLRTHPPITVLPRAGASFISDSNPCQIVLHYAEG